MKRVLEFLGRDNGFGKDNTSAYVIIGNRLILIDCGYTVFPKILEKNLLENISQIDVIITHMHADHVGSLSQLALYSYFNLKKPINIITECREIDNFLTITGVPRYNQVPGFPRQRYTRYNDFVTFIPTWHVGDELDCYGFSANINNQYVVYTGDTATLDPFKMYIIPNTQLFVDASISGGIHLDLKENLPFLSKIAETTSDVYLMHLDDEVKIRELIRETYIQICDDY